jgi:repressor LexA
VVPKTPPGETRERIFRFVRERLLRGQPPTVREVQAAFGFRAVQSARVHLEKLVEEGRLEKAQGRARGYRLPDAQPMSLIPLLGQVQAGDFTTALQEWEGQVPVRAASPEGLFALRVRGESMRDAGILPDDLVIVRQQPQADSGQIVVALVDDEATVKTLRKRGRRLELHPANPAFSVLVPEPGQCQLLGKVIEVRRYFEGGPDEQVVEGFQP